MAVMPTMSRLFGECDCVTICIGSSVHLYVFINARFLVEKLQAFSKIGNRTSLEVDLQTVDGSFHLEMNDGSGSITQVEHD